MTKNERSNQTKASKTTTTRAAAAAAATVTTTKTCKISPWINSIQTYITHFFVNLDLSFFSSPCSSWMQFLFFFIGSSEISERNTHTNKWLQKLKCRYFFALYSFACTSIFKSMCDIFILFPFERYMCISLFVYVYAFHAESMKKKKLYSDFSPLSSSFIFYIISTELYRINNKKKQQQKALLKRRFVDDRHFLGEYPEHTICAINSITNTIHTQTHTRTNMLYFVENMNNKICLCRCVSLYWKIIGHVVLGVCVAYTVHK